MSHATWAIGSEILGYRLERCAGRDLFGDVFLARSAAGRPVAVRALDPELADDAGLLMDFYQGAKFGMSVDHPGVLKVLEVGQADDGRHCLVTEFLGTENLQSRVDRLGPFKEADAVRLVDQLAKTLESLHEDPDRPVVHRALMPANVLLDPLGQPMLAGMQFGSPVHQPLPFPAHGVTAELYQYLAPEQIDERHHAHPAADVYSLGALLYSLLTAKIPFAGNDARDSRRKKLALDFQTPERLVPGLSRGVVQLVRDCLQPDAGRRPCSMRRLREILNCSGRMIGEYRIQSYRGRGPAGEVYEAVSPTAVPVAIHVVSSDIAADPLRRQRFYRGALASIPVSHPRVVESLGVEKADGRHFLVTEFAEGDNLAWLVPHQGPFPEREALDIAVEVAAGLEEIHEYQLVHRNVQPANILIQPDGHVKLTNLAFGNCIEPAGETLEDPLDLETCQYLAPEQFASPKQVDHRGDLYSLGVTLFVLLTGRLPFRPSNATEMLMDKATNAFPTVRQMNPGISDATSRLVAWLMQADADRRPPSAESFSKAARECLRRLAVAANASAPKKADDEDSGSEPVSDRPRRKRSSRRSKKTKETLSQKLALGLGFLFAAMIAGWLLVQSL